MVAYHEIQASNALINDATAPGIAVFVGGTSGIGKLTIGALVATGASMRIYLVGRKSSEEPMRGVIQEWHTINPKAEIVWTEGEVSLLAETKRICDVIKSKESRIDLLFLTTGYSPFGARKETSEGLEIAHSLEYYTRMLFIQHLLPLMNKAEAPRVVSVLGGGLEGMNMHLDLDDLGLKKPGSFSTMKAQPHYIRMNTLNLEKLANDNPNVTFVHSWPGWVNTGNVKRSAEPDSWWSWVVWLILEPLVAIFSSSDEMAAQRHLFQCTSAAFGGRGVPWNGNPGMNSLEKPENGLFLVNYKCDCTPNAKTLRALREKKAVEKVWEHTQEVLGPHL